MFDNIGQKIKWLAKFIFIIQSLVFIVFGVILITSKTIFKNLGWVVMIVGVLFSWISSWLLYGIGQVMENSDTIARNTTIIAGKMEMYSAPKESTTKKTPPSQEREASGKETVSANTSQNSNNSLLVCPLCGRKNVSSSTRCWSCDKPL